MEVVGQAEERVHLLWCKRSRDFEHGGLSLRKVCDGLVGDEEAMELDLRQPELAFGSFDDKVLSIKSFEGLAKMDEVFFKGVRSNCAIVEVADEELI